MCPEIFKYSDVRKCVMVPTSIDNVIIQEKFKEYDKNEIIKTSVITSLVIRNGLEKLQYKYEISRRKLTLALTMYGVSVFDSKYGDTCEELMEMRDNLLDISSSGIEVDSIICASILDTIKVYVNNLQSPKRDTIYMYRHVHDYIGGVARVLSADFSGIARLILYMALKDGGIKIPDDIIPKFEESLFAIHKLYGIILDNIKST